MNEAEHIAEIHRREARQVEFAIFVAAIVIGGTIAMIVFVVRWLAEVL